MQLNPVRVVAGTAAVGAWCAGLIALVASFPHPAVALVAAPLY